ncbi:MAG: hypothetical protein ACK4NS_10205 [Saprospiraceae bacterium]
MKKTLLALCAILSGSFVLQAQVKSVVIKATADGHMAALVKGVQDFERTIVFLQLPAGSAERFAPIALAKAEVQMLDKWVVFRSGHDGRRVIFKLSDTDGPEAHPGDFIFNGIGIGRVQDPTRYEAFERTGDTPLFPTLLD